jgi:hypothetical protein
MGAGKKSTGRRSSKMPKKLLVWAGAAGVLGTSTLVHAHVEATRQALEARVAAVRAALRASADVDQPVDPCSRVAQWMNWPNWNNWNNWPNWGNWGNWGNWFNR